AVTIHRFGAFDLDALRRALNALIDRHEIWRTTYEERDGRICAVVHEKTTLDVDLVDVSHLGEAEREQKALEVATADARSPFDRPPPEGPRHRGSMVTFELSPELSAALKSVSVERHATLYSTLLTAFKAMLHRYSGQEDIAIGGATDIRNRLELERSVGYFL